MGRGTLSALLAGLFAGVIAASCSSTTNEGTGGRPDGGAICLAGHDTCGAGLSCVNSNCVPTCSPSSPCPTGSYCEGDAPRNVCAPLEPVACVVNEECPLPQTCFSGLCSALQNRADGGVGGCAQGQPDDLCAPDALCLQFQSASTGSIYKQCAGFPACAEDGGCPVGGFGSVCNDLPDGGRLIPAKQRICLFSFCVQNSDCPQSPTATHCQRASAAIPYGECFTGGTGDPCFSNADCPQSPACVGVDGGLDDGGTAGKCSCSDGGAPPCN